IGSSISSSTCSGSRRSCTACIRARCRATPRARTRSSKAGVRAWWPRSRGTWCRKPANQENNVDFSHSDKVKDLQARVTRFMEENIYPAEPVFAAEVDENRRRGNAWVATRIMEQLKAKARAAGLWN